MWYCFLRSSCCASSTASRERRSSSSRVSVRIRAFAACSPRPPRHHTTAQARSNSAHHSASANFDVSTAHRQHQVRRQFRAWRRHRIAHGVAGAQRVAHSPWCCQCIAHGVAQSTEHGHGGVRAQRKSLSVHSTQWVLQSAERQECSESAWRGGGRDLELLAEVLDLLLRGVVARLELLVLLHQHLPLVLRVDAPLLQHPVLLLQVRVRLLQRVVLACSRRPPSASGTRTLTSASARIRVC
eukprot:3779034-Rhodomonas_salina.1